MGVKGDQMRKIWDCSSTASLGLKLAVFYVMNVDISPYKSLDLHQTVWGGGQETGEKKDLSYVLQGTGQDFNPTP